MANLVDIYPDIKLLICNELNKQINGNIYLMQFVCKKWYIFYKSLQLSTMDNCKLLISNLTPRYLNMPYNKNIITWLLNKLHDFYDCVKRFIIRHVIKHDNIYMLKWLYKYTNLTKYEVLYYYFHTNKKYKPKIGKWLIDHDLLEN